MDVTIDQVLLNSLRSSDGTCSKEISFGRKNFFYAFVATFLVQPKKEEEKRNFYFFSIEELLKIFFQVERRSTRIRRWKRKMKKPLFVDKQKTKHEEMVESIKNKKDMKWQPCRHFYSSRKYNTWFIFLAFAARSRKRSWSRTCATTTDDEFGDGGGDGEPQ